MYFINLLRVNWDTNTELFLLAGNLESVSLSLVRAVCTVCPSSRAVKGAVFATLAYWDYVFDSHRGYGCLSSVSCVCQVEVSATS